MREIETIRINNFELKLADSDDPIALKVSWIPAKPGGASIKMHQMEDAGSKIIVRRSGKAKLFASIFAIPGFCALFIGAPWAFTSGDIRSGIFAAVWGSLFGAAGWLLLRDKPFVFDRNAGVYFRGKTFNYNATIDSKNQGKLNSIHAIQLLSERINSGSDSGSGTYLSYELNLVFKNAERLNVMDGGDEEYVQNSAKKLASFLSVPVWKASY